LLSFIARRLLATLPVLLIVAVLVFMILRLAPGDPAAILAGDAANTEQIARIRADLGLEKPLVAQFGIWIGNMARGDLGESFYYKMKVATLIGQRLEPTLALATLTILFAVAIAVPLGVVAAWRFGGWFGWAKDEKLMELRAQFMRATDEATKKKLADAVQARAFEIGTHVPLGEYSQPMAARKNISGFFITNGNIYWNIRKN